MCGLQRHEADHDGLQDPLLGYGDPYRGQDPAAPASSSATPPGSHTSKATTLLETLCHVVQICVYKVITSSIMKRYGYIYVYVQKHVSHGTGCNVPEDLLGSYKTAEIYTRNVCCSGLEQHQYWTVSRTQSFGLVCS